MGMGSRAGVVRGGSSVGRAGERKGKLVVGRGQSLGCQRPGLWKDPRTSTGITLRFLVEGDVDLEVIPVEEGSLKAGDLIVTNAVAFLEDGTAVLSNAAN